MKLNFEVFTETTYESTNMIEGILYEMRVFAVNAIGVSQPSVNTKPFMPIGDAPLRPLRAPVHLCPLPCPSLISDPTPWPWTPLTLRSPDSCPFSSNNSAHPPPTPRPHSWPPPAHVVPRPPPAKILDSVPGPRYVPDPQPTTLIPFLTPALSPDPSCTPLLPLGFYSAHQ